MRQASLSMVFSSVTQFPHLENRFFWGSLWEVLGFSPNLPPPGHGDELVRSLKLLALTA